MYAVNKCTANNVKNNYYNMVVGRGRERFALVFFCFFVKIIAPVKVNHIIFSFAGETSYHANYNRLGNPPLRTYIHE